MGREKGGRGLRLQGLVSFLDGLLGRCLQCIQFCSNRSKGTVGKDSFSGSILPLRELRFVGRVEVPVHLRGRCRPLSLRGEPGHGAGHFPALGQVFR